jgi:uncharacterized protein
MKIVVPGGSGHVGTVLSDAFARDGHERRGSQPAAHGAASSDGRMGRRARGRVGACARRVPSVRPSLDARARRACGCRASTATIYAHRYDAPNDERTGILGGDGRGAPDTWRFSIDVARAWEDAFDEAAVPSTRKVALRSAITMGPEEPPRGSRAPARRGFRVPFRPLGRRRA